MKRNEVWWADFGEPRGSEPAYRRPVIIIQDDRLNQSALATVMVVPLTTNLDRGKAAGNCVLRSTETQLPKDSVAICSQIRTTNRDVLVDRVGVLPRRSVDRLNVALALALGLIE